MSDRSAGRWGVTAVFLAFLLGGCATEGTTPISGGGGVADIETSAGLDGTIGTAYGGGSGVAFTVSGGSGASYYWTVTGTPPGLATTPPSNSTLSPSLVLAGTPTTSGQFSIQISVHSVGHEALVTGKTYTINIGGITAGLPGITTTRILWPLGSFPTYQPTLSATGGVPPYAWSATGLPLGLSLSSGGRLSGTTTQSGTFSSVITIVDSANQTVSAALTIRIFALDEFKGTWTGRLTGQTNLADQRLSLLINDTGTLTGGTLDAQVLTMTSQFYLSPPPGLFQGSIVSLEQGHLICDPIITGSEVFTSIDCVVHFLTGTGGTASVVLSRLNLSTIDTVAPVVDSPANVVTITLPQLSIVFRESMSGNVSALSLTGGTGTMISKAFSSTTLPTPPNTTLNISFTGLQSGISYTLTLNPVGITSFRDLAGNALAITTVTFTTGALPILPSPSTNLAAIDRPADQGKAINLTWTPPGGSDVSSQKMYRATVSGGPWTPITTTLSGTANTYTDADPTLVNGTRFYYVVRAVNGAGESDPSNETSAIPADNLPPASPTALMAADRANDSGGTIVLNWTDSPSGDVVSHRVYRLTPSGYVIIASVSNGLMTFTNTGLTDGTRYYYVIRAFDGTQESANSNEESAVPLDDGAPNPGGPPTATSLTFTLNLRHPVCCLYTSQYAITLQGSSPSNLPLTFQIVRRPTYQDSTISVSDTYDDMNMEVGTPYQWWNGTGWKSECGWSINPLFDTCRATTSTTIATNGTVTPLPAGSPPTVIYTPIVCGTFRPLWVDTFQYIAIDSQNRQSATATVTLQNSDGVCSH